MLWLYSVAKSADYKNCLTALLRQCMRDNVQEQVRLPLNHKTIIPRKKAFHRNIPLSVCIIQESHTHTYKKSITIVKCLTRVCEKSVSDVTEEWNSLKVVNKDSKTDK